jgi:WD40 repeat protein
VLQDHKGRIGITKRVLRGHDDIVTSIAVSNSGRLLASGQKGNNSDVLVWDYAGGKVLYKLSEHDHEVAVVRFSHDDRLLYSCGNFLDKKMFVWDTKTGNIVASCAMADSLVAMCWGGMVKDIKWRDTPSHRFAELYKEKVVLGEVDSRAGQVKREAINIQSAKREFTCIAFSQPEEKFIFTGTTSADFFIIDHKNKSLLSVISLGTLGVSQVISLGPDSMLVGCGNGVLARYNFDSKSWNSTAQLSIKHRITSLSAARGEILVGTSLSQALIVSQAEFQPFLVQESHNGKINFVRFRDDDSQMFGVASEDCTIRFWDLKNRKVRVRVELGDQVAPKCFQVREELMFSGWADRSLRMHDLTSGKQIWCVENCQKGGVTTLELSRDSKNICTGGSDGTVRLWTLSTKNLICNLQEHAAEITKVKMISGDTNLLTSSKDKSIFLWDLQKQKRIMSFYHAFGSVNAFDVFPEGNSLISTGQDRKITFWDIRTPTAVNSLVLLRFAP